MNIFGIVRNAANLIIARYVNDDLRQPNLTDKGNLAVEQILTGPLGLVPTVADTDDNSIASEQTLALGITENYVFSVATGVWIRQHAIAYADNIAPVNLTSNAAFLYGFDGATADRLQSSADDIDGAGGLVSGSLITSSRNWLLNGNSYDRARSTSATVQANFAAHVGIAAVAMAGNWSIHHDPAVNVQATITRAAGAAGVRHICTSSSATFAAGATAGAAVKVYLRDGATGAGTILWSGVLTAPVASDSKLLLSGLSVVGSAATAMTLEFAAAGGLTTFENVSLTGYSVAA